MSLDEFCEQIETLLWDAATLPQHDTKSPLQQQELLEEALKQICTIDKWTQLPNRHCFDEYFNREWRRMAREKKFLSLILCDIDFFKAYNITYGYQAGNNCLKQIAQAISRSVKRPADLITRYEGEKFAVILPDTTAEGAIQVAERIRSAVEALEIVNVSSPTKHYITLSLGVASIVPKPESLLTTLMVAADQALYRAKAEGYNLVIPVGVGDHGMT